LYESRACVFSGTPRAETTRRAHGLSSIDEENVMTNDSASGDATESVDTPMNPGDEAPEGSPSSGENVCPHCGGSGRHGSEPCLVCGGTGKVTVGVG
jgi:DnaJ-class molecular chaperone